jgi:hypothetical protein
MEPKPMHPSSSRAFQRHQKHDLKHEASRFGGSHNYKTKQTTFLHRHDHLSYITKKIRIKKVLIPINVPKTRDISNSVILRI